MELLFESLNLFAGMDWVFDESLSDYPSDEYNLDIILKKGSGTPLTLTGTSNADLGFDFSKAAADTALIGYGEFSYQAIMTRITDTRIMEVKAGSKHIMPLLSLSGDTRTYWEIIRDEAKDCYTKLSKMIVTEVNFKGKVLKYEDRNKIREMIAIAEQGIEEERAIQSGEIRKPKIYKAVIK